MALALALYASSLALLPGPLGALVPARRTGSLVMAAKRTRAPNRIDPAKGFGVQAEQRRREAVTRKRARAASTDGPQAGSREEVLPARAGQAQQTDSGLDALVCRQHEENCVAAVALYGMSSDMPSEATYTGGWEEWVLPADTVSPGNAPYATNSLLLRSTGQLLSDDEAQALVRMADAHGASCGWDQRYPIDGYTHEVNVRDMPDAAAVLGPLLRERLLPAAAAAFPAFRPSSLRVYDALIVQYNAETGHNCLPVHQDFAQLTLNIALSASSDYTGGGTWFQHFGDVMRAERGRGLLHAGRLPHCGVPVDTGVRYQLVLFLISADHIDTAARLKAVGAALGAKAADPGGRATGTPVDEPLSTRALRLSLRANPRDAEAWAQLAHNSRWRGDGKAAAHEFAQVVELSGRRDFAALCNLGWEQHMLGKDEDALKILTDALAIGPPPGPSTTALELNAQHTLALVLIGLRRHEDAGLILENIVNADEKRAESWAALGLCMAQLGAEAAAMVCQKRVIALAAPAREGQG